MTSAYSFDSGALIPAHVHLSGTGATEVIPSQPTAVITSIILADISGSGDTVLLDIYDGATQTVIQKVATVPANGTYELPFDQLILKSQSLRATATTAGRINVFANYVRPKR